MITLILLILTGFDARADVGFHVIDSSAPAVVSDNQKNVFQLVAPGGKEFVSIDISGETNESLAEIAEARAADRWRPDIRAKLILSQLLFCKEKAKKLCPFFETLKMSSAFLVKDPHVITATFHGVEDLVNLRRDEFSLSDEDLAGMNIPLVLLTKDGEIARAGDTGLQVRKLFRALDISVFSGDGFEGGIPYLASAPHDLELYGMGFPSATFTRVREGREDAKDDTLTWTKGSLPSTLTRVLALPSLALAKASGDFFLTNLDGNGGMSGGPVINEGGFVVGVVAKGVFEAGRECQAPKEMMVANLSAALGSLE